jgi:hypothetical protein
VAEAQALVAGQSGHLFAAYRGKPLSDMAMTALMDRAGLSARPHGFRSTFRTWAEECTKADFETKEACLGHAVDVGVVGAYQRGDRLAKRRKLLEAWHKHLTRPIAADGVSGAARSARRRAAPAQMQIPERGTAWITGIFFVAQVRNDIEGKGRTAMRVPGFLQRAVRIGALAQREPQAVLDGGKVRRAADPHRIACRAADGVDAAAILRSL